ncbi:ATP-binding protein [Nocardia aurantia]|uniref:Regulatory protein AfsR n=1 Tax=Nocardia aurantia TaxID=2585199 RepID=A0A7K0DNP3_9NOCA|nr:tetratricopeptide repeat protein [Nocardia aurantia]MQY27363.1 Regulatory protein AfsR [Nocardia aurantia]
MNHEPGSAGQQDLGAPDPRRVTDPASLVGELELLRMKAAYGTGRIRVSVDDLRRKLPDIPRSTLASYLSGRHFPSADILDRIVIALGASADQQRAWGEAWFAASESRAAHRWAVRNTVPVVTPRELPADITDFTGRQIQLRTLDSWSTGSGTGPTVVAIVGAAGAGKTALAVHWAQANSRRFPDGQIYIDLQGYDPQDRISPAEALAVLLRSLGVHPDEIPSDEAERAARYRTVLTDRRMVVLLDNARSVEHVRPLLPGTASCLVIVTSRESLAGLVARHGAKRIELEAMPVADAVSLLRALLDDRVDTERDAVLELIDRCARLPLTLRILAEHLAGRPAADLTAVAAEFARGNPLDHLEAGADPRTDVRSVFSWSLGHLDTDTIAIFRLLGSWPGHDFDPYIAAAMADLDLPRARRAVSALRRAHLVEQRGPHDRYGMHDLLRIYAGEQAERIPESDRQSSLQRLLDYFRHTISSAVDTIHVGAEDFRPSADSVGTPTPDFRDAESAASWLAAEQDNIVRLAIHAARHGHHGYAIDYVQSLNRDLYNGALHAEVSSILGPALDAARLRGDARGETYALNTMAAIHARRGDYAQSRDCSRAALSACRRAREQLSASGSAGLADSRLHQGAGSIRTAISKDVGFRIGEAVALNNLGTVYTRSGRYTEAAAFQAEALELLRDIGFRVIDAAVLVGLGDIRMRQGRYGQATTYCRQALVVALRAGHHAIEGIALTRLGEILTRQGRYVEAADRHREAGALAQRTENLGLAAEAANGLGETLHAIGEYTKALNCHTDAVIVARSIGHRHERARALTGIARAQRSLGRPQEARRHSEQALEIYRELDVPEDGEICVRSGGATGPVPRTGDRIPCTDVGGPKCR